MSTNSPVVRVKEKIDLKEKEKIISERLLATVRHCDLPTQLRVAGCWLLGKGCYDIDIDIDIALDDMLGSTFVDRVTQYLASTGEEARGLAVIPRILALQKRMLTEEINYKQAQGSDLRWMKS